MKLTKKCEPIDPRQKTQAHFVDIFNENKEAALKGSLVAKLNLAGLYAYGIGTERDIEKASFLLNRIKNIQQGIRLVIKDGQHRQTQIHNEKRQLTSRQQGSIASLNRYIKQQHYQPNS